MDKPKEPCWEYRPIRVDEANGAHCVKSRFSTDCCDTLEVIRFVDLKTYPSGNANLYPFCINCLFWEIEDMKERLRKASYAKWEREKEKWEFSIANAEQLLHQLQGRKLTLVEVRELLKI